MSRKVKTTGLYFLIGIALSAVFQRYIPGEAMIAMFGGDEAFGVLMAATIGYHSVLAGRDGTTLASMDGGRHEQGKRGGVRAHRAVYKNHQSGRGENRAGSEAVRAVHCFCRGVFAGDGAGGKLCLIEKILFQGGVRWHNADIQLGDVPKMRKENAHKTPGGYDADQLSTVLSDSKYT